MGEANVDVLNVFFGTRGHDELDDLSHISTYFI